MVIVNMFLTIFYGGGTDDLSKNHQHLKESLYPKIYTKHTIKLYNYTIIQSR